MSRVALPLLTLLAAIGVAIAGLHYDGAELARLLTTHDSLYGPALWWALLAPIPLAVAWGLTRVTPWPWVVVVTVHLAVLLATAVRLRHLLPGWTTPALLVVIGLGVGAVIAVLQPDRPDGRD